MGLLYSFNEQYKDPEIQMWLTDPPLTSKSSQWCWWGLEVTKSKASEPPLDLWPSANCTLSEVIKLFLVPAGNIFIDVSPSLPLSFSKRDKTFFPGITAWVQINRFSVSDHVLVIRKFSASQISAFCFITRPLNMGVSAKLTLGVHEYVLVVFRGLCIW